MKNLRILAALLVFGITTQAQTVNGNIKIDDQTEGKCLVTPQIKLESGFEKLGTATIKLKYDSKKYHFPTKAIYGEDYNFHNFSNGDYALGSIVKSKEGMLTISLYYNEGNGTLVANNLVDIVTINFDVVDEDSENTFEWNKGEFYSPESNVQWELGKITSSFAENNSEMEGAIPSDFQLYENYPNPFNPNTTIKYFLPSNSKVDIIIFNVLGQKVDQLVMAVQESGYHKVDWNATNMASGTYFLKLTAKSTESNQEYTNMKKMMLLK